MTTSQAKAPITRAIAEFASSLTFDQVPPQAVPRVKAAFADCIGVILQGSDLPVGRIALQFAGGSKRKAGEPYLGALGLAAPQTGLVYGTASHALDFDDTGLNGHPSAILVPAILAAAEHCPANGTRMIAAYLAGFESWAELSSRDADSHHEKGWHPSPVFGVIAATAAVSNLRRLDVETTQRAIGIAASSAAGICANFGTMMKPFQLGRAIQFALDAVEIAELGLTSGSEALEADLGFLRAFSPKGNVDTQRPVRLGDHWEFLTSGINIKLYPMCYATHRAIDAALELKASNGLSADEIEALEVELGPTQAAILQHHDPKTVLNAKFSAEFAVSAALLHGRLGNDELSDSVLHDPRLRRLISATKVTIVNERDPEYPVFSPHDVVHATLRDGRRISSAPVRHPRGHHVAFPDKEELFVKFADCVRGELDPKQARALYDRIFELDRAGSVSEIYAGSADGADKSERGPLSGITVVELGTSVAGPIASLILAELGADVVKIENPKGDDARLWGPPFLGQAAAMFQAINRNKKSAVTDFKNADSLDSLKRFIADEADVVIQNLRPGVVEKFGLDAASLRAKKRSLIYCNMSAFGPSGPLSAMPGYDPLVQAFGGIMSVTGHEDAEPVRVGPSLLDQGSGMWAAIGILSALLDRKRTGLGRSIDTSLLETALSWLCMQVAQYQASGRVPRRVGSENGGMVPYKAYQATDGWIVIAAANDGLFRRFCEAVGHTEWLADPQFTDNPSRVTNRVRLNALIADVIATKPRQHWIEVLQKAQVPCAAIQSLDEVLDHPQTIATGMYQDSPEGTMRLMGLPLRFDGMRPAFRAEPPLLGAHSDLLANKPATN